MDLCLPITKNYAGNLGNRATALENQSPVNQTVQAPKWYLLANDFKKRAAKFEPPKYKQNVAHSWIIPWSLLRYMEEFNTENSTVLQQTSCTGLKIKCVSTFLQQIPFKLHSLNFLKLSYCVNNFLPMCQQQPTRLSPAFVQSPSNGLAHWLIKNPVF